MATITLFMLMVTVNNVKHFIVKSNFIEFFFLCKFISLLALRQTVLCVVLFQLMDQQNSKSISYDSDDEKHQSKAGKS